MAAPVRAVTPRAPASFEAQLPEYARRQPYHPYPDVERRGGSRLHGGPESVRMLSLDYGNKGENNASCGELIDMQQTSQLSFPDT